MHLMQLSRWHHIASISLLFSTDKENSIGLQHTREFMLTMWNHYVNLCSISLQQFLGCNVLIRSARDNRYQLFESHWALNTEHLTMNDYIDWWSTPFTRQFIFGFCQPFSRWKNNNFQKISTSFKFVRYFKQMVREVI